VVLRQQPRVQAPNPILNERNTNYKMPHKDPEKLREYQRKWCENNPDRKEYLREYRLKNKEKRNEDLKQWRKDNPVKTQKSRLIIIWRYWGVKGDLQAIYERWLNTTHCDVCKVSLEGKKCMDHDHQSGEFRHILCNSCNVNDFWMKVKTSSS